MSISAVITLIITLFKYKNKKCLYSLAIWPQLIRWVDLIDLIGRSDRFSRKKLENPFVL